MITIRVNLYDTPIHSPLALELAEIGIASLSELEKVSTILRVEKGNNLLENIEWRHPLTADEIEKIRVWAEEKYGEDCAVQVQ